MPYFQRSIWRQKRKPAGCTGMLLAVVSSSFTVKASTIICNIEGIHPYFLIVLHFLIIFIFSVPEAIACQENVLGPHKLQPLLITRLSVGVITITLNFAFENLTLYKATFMIFSLSALVTVASRIFMKEFFGFVQSLTTVFAANGVIFLSQISGALDSYFRSHKVEDSNQSLTVIGTLGLNVKPIPLNSEYTIMVLVLQPIFVLFFNTFTFPIIRMFSVFIQFWCCQRHTDDRTFPSVEIFQNALPSILTHSNHHACQHSLPRSESVVDHANSCTRRKCCHTEANSNHYEGNVSLCHSEFVGCRVETSRDRMDSQVEPHDCNNKNSSPRTGPLDCWKYCHPEAHSNHCKGHNFSYRTENVDCDVENSTDGKDYQVDSHNCSSQNFSSPTEPLDCHAKSLCMCKMYSHLDADLKFCTSYHTPSDTETVGCRVKTSTNNIHSDSENASSQTSLSSNKVVRVHSMTSDMSERYVNTTINTSHSSSQTEPLDSHAKSFSCDTSSLPETDSKFCTNQNTPSHTENVGCRVKTSTDREDLYIEVDSYVATSQNSLSGNKVVEIHSISSDVSEVDVNPSISSYKNRKILKTEPEKGSKKIAGPSVGDKKVNVRFKACTRKARKVDSDVGGNQISASGDNFEGALSNNNTMKDVICDGVVDSGINSYENKKSLMDGTSKTVVHKSNSLKLNKYVIGSKKDANLMVARKITDYFTNK